MVAVYWSDLDPSSDGQVFTHHTAERMVIEWNAIPYWNLDCNNWVGTSRECTRAENPVVTFEAVIWRNSSMQFNYKNVTTPASNHEHAPVQIGLENEQGTHGLAIVLDLDVVMAQTSIIVPASCSTMPSCSDSRFAEPDDCGVCNGDGSTCRGCMDILAENYERQATIDDGSCEYTHGQVITCPSSGTEEDSEATVPLSERFPLQWSIRWSTFEEYEMFEKVDTPGMAVEYHGRPLIDVVGIHFDGGADGVSFPTFPD